MTKKKEPQEMKRTKREIALANLEKANAVKRGEIPAKPKTNNRTDQSLQRLDRIIERVEKQLSDGDVLEKADTMKLATALKVCHNQRRVLREETEGEPVIRTHAEAQAKINEELAALCAALKKLPPGAKRHLTEMFDEHLS
jgi:paraquat-inducible protein B